MSLFSLVFSPFAYLSFVSKLNYAKHTGFLSIFSFCFCF